MMNQEKTKGQLLNVNKRGKKTEVESKIRDLPLLVPSPFKEMMRTFFSSCNGQGS